MVGNELLVCFGLVGGVAVEELMLRGHVDKKGGTEAWLILLTNSINPKHGYEQNGTINHKSSLVQRSDSYSWCGSDSRHRAALEPSKVKEPNEITYPEVLAYPGKCGNDRNFQARESCLGTDARHHEKLRRA